MEVKEKKHENSGEKERKQNVEKETIKTFQTKVKNGKQKCKARKREMGWKVSDSERIIRRYTVTVVDDSDEEEDDTPQPFINVRVGEEQVKTHAFLDTGADGNTISFELFACLNNIQITQTKAQFKDYSGHVTPAFGVCTLMINVEGLTCGDEFFITQPSSVQDVPLILGRSWQRRYNCYFN